MVFSKGDPSELVANSMSNEPIAVGHRELLNQFRDREVDLGQYRKNINDTHRVDELVWIHCRNTCSHHRVCKV